MGSTQEKKNAAYHAVDKYIQCNMVVGLGTGSTVFFVLERLGEKIKKRELTNIVCIPTSETTRQQAETLSIPLTTLDEHSTVDVVIDGADEIDASLNLVKGRGAALLREKMVAQCAEKFVVVSDATKLCPEGLGANGALPVEVTKFGCHHTLNKLTKLPSLAAPFVKGVLRKCKDSDALLETDNGNYIVDLFLPAPIKDLPAACRELSDVAGVVEHGIFLNMANVVVVGKPNGSVDEVHEPTEKKPL